jgi:hypothetical protein
VDEDEEDEPIEKKRKTLVKDTDQVAVVKTNATNATKTNNNSNAMVIDKYEFILQLLGFFFIVVVLYCIVL